MSSFPDAYGPVVMVAVLGVYRGQQPGLQPGERGRPESLPPRAQHLGGRDLILALPRHQHQVTGQRGHDLAVASVGHHAHQQARADRERGRHRPPGLPFHRPGQRHLPGDLVDHAGTEQLIDLPLGSAQPGMVSGMPARLDPAVARGPPPADRDLLFHDTATSPVRITGAPATTVVIRAPSACLQVEQTPDPASGPR